MDDLLPGLDVVPAHPMFVHFPIALWMTGLAILALAVVRRHEDGFRMARLLAELGTATAVVTIVTGFLASSDLGHDGAGHGLVHTHRNPMLAATSLAVVAVALGRLWSSRAGRIARLVALLLCCVVTFFGADRGGYMVYGEGVGVQTER